MRALFAGLWTIVFTTLLTVSFYSVPVEAAASSKNKSAPQSEIVTDRIQIPGHGLLIVSNINNARILLNDGNIDAAMDLITKAKELLNKDIAQYAVKLKNQPGYGIPIDSSVYFSEDFVPNKKQAETIQKAETVARKEGISAGYKTMIADGITLNFRFLMLPVASTLKGLDKIIAEMKDKKYFKANLDLKAIEYSLLIEDLGAYETPKQGVAWETAAKM